MPCIAQRVSLMTSDLSPGLVCLIPIDQILHQPHAIVDPVKVARITALMQRVGDTLEPIRIAPHPECDGYYVSMDGQHCLLAMRALRLTTIRCRRWG